MEKGKFFGEMCFFKEEEREEAKCYLNSWKKFLLRKLIKDSYDVKIINEQWGENPAYLNGMMNQMPLMYLKLFIEADWHYELGKMK